jgi:hypothetical protein
MARAANCNNRDSERPAGSWGQMLHQLCDQAEGGRADVFVAAHESLPVQVFGRRNAETLPALGQPASEKRQGTKSPCGAPTVQRGLWGFGGGGHVGDVRLRLAIGALWRESWACVLARTSAWRGGQQDLRCDHGPILRTGASGGAAVRAQARMACVGAVSDRG